MFHGAASLKETTEENSIKKKQIVSYVKSGKMAGKVRQLTFLYFVLFV